MFSILINNCICLYFLREFVAGFFSRKLYFVQSNCFTCTDCEKNIAVIYCCMLFEKKSNLGFSFLSNRLLNCLIWSWHFVITLYKNIWKVLCYKVVVCTITTRFKCFFLVLYFVNIIIFLIIFANTFIYEASKKFHFNLSI